MKKLNYFLLAVFVATTFSCNESEDVYFHEVETVLEMDIPIISVNSDDLKSAADQLNNEIPFAGSNDFRLTDMVTTSGATSNVRSISPHQGAILSIPGIKEEYVISSLTLHWGYKNSLAEDFTMMESIDLLSLNHTLANETLQIELDEIANRLVSEIHNSEFLLRFSITGNCNFTFNSLANYQIPVTIESELNTTRFELF